MDCSGCLGTRGVPPCAPTHPRTHAPTAAGWQENNRGTVWLMQNASLGSVPNSSRRAHTARALSPTINMSGFNGEGHPEEKVRWRVVIGRKNATKKVNLMHLASRHISTHSLSSPPPAIARLVQHSTSTC